MRGLPRLGKEMDMATVFGPSNGAFEVEGLEADMSEVICSVAWTVGDVAGLLAERNGGKVTDAELEAALGALRGGRALQDQQVQDGWETIDAIV